MTGRALFQPPSLSVITLVVTLILSVLAPASAVAAPEGQLLTLIASHPYSSPYEDLKLKAK